MREQFEHVLAASGAVVIALYISYFHTGGSVASTTPSLAAKTVSATTSELVVVGTSSPPDLIISTSTFEKIFPSKPVPNPVFSPAPKPVPKTKLPAPSLPPAPKVSPTTTPKTTPATTKPTTPPPPAPATPPVVTVASSTPTPPPAETSTLLSTLSPSVVNILCIANDGSLRSISGSGVIIDSRGIILTVAHVAQSVLLQEYLGKDKESCVVRTGSPAHSSYYVRPIYVSTFWVHANSTTLISSQPMGTGENDFALLGITGSATGASLPSSYPAVSISGSTAHNGDSVGIGSYGAQYLTSAEVRSALYATLVMSSVADRYTFTTNTVDVLSINGTKASQEGSSGGAIVNTDGALIGIITTSDNTGDFSTRLLRAITPLHISRSFSDDTGESFDSYVNGNSVTGLVNSYAPKAQTLGAFLAKAIGLAQ